ncbi:MAG: hypothetical protein Q4D52_01180 [Eubacteriales bacterium]|nr:hypothetical protein [Eubacteriales bacterium]
MKKRVYVMLLAAVMTALPLTTPLTGGEKTVTVLAAEDQTAAVEQPERDQTPVTEQTKKEFFEVFDGIQRLHDGKYGIYEVSTSVGDAPYLDLRRVKKDNFVKWTDGDVRYLVYFAMRYIYEGEAYSTENPEIKTYEEALARLRRDIRAFETIEQAKVLQQKKAEAVQKVQQMTYLNQQRKEAYKQAIESCQTTAAVEAEVAKAQAENEKAKPKNGWVDENGERYYYENNEKKTSQWINDTFYVDADGKLLKSTFTPDGYRVGKDGAWAKGSWKQDKRGWWYRFEDGFYYTSGWFTIKKQLFHFDAYGYLTVNGWVDDYYVNADGIRLSDTYTPDGYRVGKDGKWMKGSWKRDRKGWWYVYADGFYHKSGWQKVEKAWYFFDKEGYISTSKWIGDYYVAANGKMLTSTYTPDGYYVAADGKWDRSVARKK